MDETWRRMFGLQNTQNLSLTPTFPGSLCHWNCSPVYIAKPNLNFTEGGVTINMTTTFGHIHHLDFCQTTNLGNPWISWWNQLEYNKPFVVSNLPTQTDPTAETSCMKKKNRKQWRTLDFRFSQRYCWGLVSVGMRRFVKWVITLILIHVPCIVYYFVQWSTNAQLPVFHKLSHSYMFRHYRVILWELIINTLPSYTSISRQCW